MAFKKLFTESWSIVIREPLFWLLSLTLYLLFFSQRAVLYKTDIPLFVVLNIFIMFGILISAGFLGFGIVYLSGQNIQGDDVGFAKIWEAFNNQLGTLIGFAVLLLAYLFIATYSISWIIFQVLNFFFGNIDASSVIDYISNMIGSAFAGPPAIIGIYSLVFENKRVVESFWIGVRYFFSSLLTYLLLSFVFLLPVLALDLLIGFIVIQGNPIFDFETFQQTKSIPISSFTYHMVQAFVEPLFITATLLLFKKSRIKRNK